MGLYSTGPNNRCNMASSTQIRAVQVYGHECIVETRVLGLCSLTNLVSLIVLITKAIIAMMLQKSVTI